MLVGGPLLVRSSRSSPPSECGRGATTQRAGHRWATRRCPFAPDSDCQSHCMYLNGACVSAKDASWGECCGEFDSLPNLSRITAVFSSLPGSFPQMSCDGTTTAWGKKHEEKKIQRPESRDTRCRPMVSQSLLLLHTLRGRFEVASRSLWRASERHNQVEPGSEGGLEERAQYKRTHGRFPTGRGRDGRRH